MSFTTSLYRMVLTSLFAVLWGVAWGVDSRSQTAEDVARRDVVIKPIPPEDRPYDLTDAEKAERRRKDEARHKAEMEARLEAERKRTEDAHREMLRQHKGVETVETRSRRSSKGLEPPSAEQTPSLLREFSFLREELAALREEIVALRRDLASSPRRQQPVGKKRPVFKLGHTAETNATLRAEKNRDTDKCVEKR